MTHMFLAHYENGNLVIAKPVICKDEEELLAKFNAFRLESIEEGIGDSASFITEEEWTIMHNLNIDEVFDVGI